LLRDDGEGSDVDNLITSVNAFTYEVVLDDTFTGKPLNVKVTANNVMGSVTSKATLLILSSVPAKPYPAPQVVTSLTSIDRITVDFEN
jgi:hypothetical protein